MTFLVKWLVARACAITTLGVNSRLYDVSYLELKNRSFINTMAYLSGPKRKSDSNG